MLKANMIAYSNAEEFSDRGRVSVPFCWSVVIDAVSVRDTGVGLDTSS
jgi:hypothetical protein